MVIKKSDKSPIHIGFYNLIIKVLYQKKNSNSRGDINMRFSTYLNNKKCMEWQLNAQQGILFSLLYDCSNWAKEVIVDGQTYYFVSRNLVINELPMFFEKPDTVYREFKKLFEKGLIKYKKNEKMDLIKITEKGKEWNFSNFENNSEKNPSFEENSEKIPNKLGKKSENNSEKNPTYNNTININNTRLILYNNNYIYSSDEFVEILTEYIQMRKKKKKEMTERAIRRLLKKIESITDGINEEKAIELLEIATDNQWQDVYDNVKKQNENNKNDKKTENNYGKSVVKERPKVTAEGLKKYFGGA